jgi:hypothetical protein
MEASVDATAAAAAAAAGELRGEGAREEAVGGRRLLTALGVAREAATEAIEALQFGLRGTTTEAAGGARTEAEAAGAEAEAEAAPKVPVRPVDTTKVLVRDTALTGTAEGDIKPRCAADGGGEPIVRTGCT